MNTIEQNAIEQNMEILAGLKNAERIRGSVSSFRSLAAARHAANVSSVKRQRIILGEDEWYWVVSPADAERLMRAGYEVIS